MQFSQSLFIQDGHDKRNIVWFKEAVTNCLHVFLTVLPRYNVSICMKILDIFADLEETLLKTVFSLQHLINVTLRCSPMYICLNYMKPSMATLNTY